MHIERIYPDEEFWCQKVPRIQHFFTTAILPELMGKFYSRTMSDHDQSTAPSEANLLSPALPPADTAQTYCYCHGPEEGNRVGCDNSTCACEWFHLDCLGLKSEPKSQNWYCPDCRKLPEFRKRRKEKQLDHDNNPNCNTELMYVSYSKGTTESQILMRAHDT